MQGGLCLTLSYENQYQLFNTQFTYIHTYTLYVSSEYFATYTYSSGGKTRKLGNSPAFQPWEGKYSLSEQFLKDEMCRNNVNNTTCFRHIHVIKEPATSVTVYFSKKKKGDNI